jgi:hypothetical protein
VAGEVALEESGCFAGGLAFGDAAGDVVAGCRVVLSSVERDRVECAVELAVAACLPAGLVDVDDR